MKKNPGRSASLAPSRSFWPRILLVFSLALAFLAAPRSDAALVFDVDYSAGVIASPKGPGIFAGVTEAAEAWSGFFGDDITVTVKVEFDSEALDVDLGPSPFTFAAALNSFEEHDYTDVAAALLVDGTSLDDGEAGELLQPGPYLEALTHDTSMTGVPSPELRIGSLAVGPKSEAKWNSVLKLTRANSKALGLPVTPDGAYDVRLVLNDESLPVFDIDRGDGIGDEEFDFQAIAAHEIGHGMGFFSGVDHLDFAGYGGLPPHDAPGPAEDFSDDAIFTVLDLFRTHPITRSDAIAFGQPDSGYVLDWRFGPPAGPFIKPFFSLDDSAEDPLMKIPYSTGDFLGDGNQASHWAVLPGPAPPLGLMTASLPKEFVLDVMGSDVLALDVIGWDLHLAAVPEPSSCLLLVLGAMGMGLSRRHHRRGG